MVWYGLTMWHAKRQMIKAFAEKQSLMDDDQSITYSGIALCISFPREPHTPVESKTGQGNAGSAHVSF